MAAPAQQQALDEGAATWGIEPVPPDRRRLSGFDVAVLWGDLSIGLLVLLTGTFLVPALGLPAASAAILVGTVLGCAALALVGHAGAAGRPARHGALPAGPRPPRVLCPHRPERRPARGVDGVRVLGDEPGRQPGVAAAVRPGRPVALAGRRRGRLHAPGPRRAGAGDPGLARTVRGVGPAGGRRVDHVPGGHRRRPGSAVEPSGDRRAGILAGRRPRHRPAGLLAPARRRLQPVRADRTRLAGRHVRRLRGRQRLVLPPGGAPRAERGAHRPDRRAASATRWPRWPAGRSSCSPSWSGRPTRRSPTSTRRRCPRGTCPLGPGTDGRCSPWRPRAWGWPCSFRPGRTWPSTGTSSSCS